MCPLNSSIHTGIQSAVFRESLLISVAIIFPMFIDLVFDTLGHFSVVFNSHCSYSTGLSTRWALILSSLLSDLILLLYVVPSGHSQLMWTIHIMRETLRIFAIYDYLQQHGGPTWNPKLVLAKVTLVGVGQCARMISFSMFDYQSYWGKLSVMINCVFFVLVGMHFIKFSKLLWKYSNESIIITSDQYRCFKYISTVLFYSMISILIFLMFGPRPVCDLDGIYLAVESYHNCGACFLLAMFHSRRSQLEIFTSTNSLELKRMFVRYVSHEIRTPLNTVTTGLILIQSLKDQVSSCTDPNTKNLLENIFSMTDDCKESCDVAVDILNELLLYEKLEGGILSLDKTVEPVKDVIHDAIHIFDIQARGCGIRMVITYDDLDGIMLEVDKPKISQVLRNLVSNAIKFSPPGSDVTVHTSVTKVTSNQDQNDGKNMFNLRISVEDSGAG